jgi:hypothetical protein
LIAFVHGSRTNAPWAKNLKVRECFNADFFQAIKLIYGYDSTVTTAGQEWTNGLNSSFALGLYQKP